MPQHKGGAAWAVDEYRKEVASVAAQLVTEFREVIVGVADSDVSGAKEEELIRKAATDEEKYAS